MYTCRSMVLGFNSDVLFRCFCSFLNNVLISAMDHACIGASFVSWGGGSLADEVTGALS